MTDGVLLESVHLKKSFDDMEVLRDINVKVQSGEVVCIIGPSGSGKSTFLRCINQLETPTGGQVLYKGQDSQRDHGTGPDKAQVQGRGGGARHGASSKGRP